MTKRAAQTLPSLPGLVKEGLSNSVFPEGQGSLLPPDGVGGQELAWGRGGIRAVGAAKLQCTQL